MAWSNTKLIAKQKELSFYSFCSTLVDWVGEIDLPINLNCHTLKEMTADMDDNFNPMKQCLIDLYKQCHCHNITSSICPIAALDVLGKNCYKLKRRSSGVDVKDVDLLEHIGILIVNTYLKEVREKTTTKNTVIRFDLYKIRLRNRR